MPISGLQGTNLVSNKEAALRAWYAGPTLVELVDRLAAPARAVDAPLRLVVSDVCRTAGGLTVGGRVETGVVGVRDRVLVQPAGECAVVRALSVAGAAADAACAGDSADVVLAAAEPGALAAGALLCDPAAPVPVAARVGARIRTFRLDFPLLPGQQCVFCGRDTSCAAVVARLRAVVDPATGAPRRRRPRHIIGDGVLADVDIALARPLCLDTADRTRALARFSLHTGGFLMAAGIITSIETPPHTH